MGLFQSLLIKIGMAEAKTFVYLSSELQSIIKIRLIKRIYKYIHSNLYAVLLFENVEYSEI
jgi:hypothetical protein